MIAAPIKMYTGNTSRKVIIIDLVRVVAKPTKKNIANEIPITAVSYTHLRAHET